MKVSCLSLANVKFNEYFVVCTKVKIKNGNNKIKL